MTQDYRELKCMTNEWVAERISDFQALAGKRVHGWRAVEMALRECAQDGLPQFEDPTIPFRQLSILLLDVESAPLEVTTYQDDDEFGLWPKIPNSPLTEFDGVYRNVVLADLPVGVIGDVMVSLNSRSNIWRVNLRIEDQEVALCAGEVEEQADGTLRCVPNDESVLLFARSSDVEAVDWDPALS